jgi:ketosteroid isomerase-like protein
MTRHLLAAALIALAAVSPAFAGKAEDEAALAPLRQFVGALNKGDIKSAAAAYAPGAVIVDEFTPYRWQGGHAFQQWLTDLETANKAAKIADAVMTLDAPRRVAVTGRRGYAVVPARYDFKQDGHPVHERGTFTVALTKTGLGWRLAAWTWTFDSESK